MYKCVHCDKEYENKRSINGHIRLCPFNPSRRQHPKLGKFGTGNQFTKAKKEGREISVSSETRNKLRSAGTGENSFWKKDGNAELRKQHSVSMKRAVENFPESYTSSNRGRTKQIIVDGIKLQGNWEVEFYKWCKQCKIQIERPIDGFPYKWNNSIRTYFPDFFLPELNIYVEVKGYETERDICKWRDFPHALIVLKKKEIQKIREGVFKLGL